jgi:type II secretory pathway component PulC
MRIPLTVLRNLTALLIVLLGSAQTSAQDSSGISNPSIDMNGYLRVSAEAAKHREMRRISEGEFIRMSQEPGTIVLDARSSQLYQFLHIRGAINLSFPDIAIESLRQTIPDKNTRILIYCNNNFVGAPVAFPTKMSSASLNLSTFIALYNYGYKNVYELGPLIDIKSAKLEFESSTNPELLALMNTDAPLQIERGDGAYLGVFLADINEERAKKLQLAEIRGAVVGKIDEGSPAASAGLKEDDVILAFNNKKVLNRAQFFIMLIEAGPGSKITLGINRKGEAQTITAELGSRRIAALVEQRQQLSKSGSVNTATVPGREEKQETLAPRKDASASQSARNEDEKNAPSPLIPLLNDHVKSMQQMASASRFYLGINTTALNEQLAKYFNVSRGGVLVTEITTGSLAERAGVKAGDCIIKVNDDSVSSVSDFNILVERLFRDQASNNANEIKTGIEFSLTLVREGAEQKINMKSDLR